jgi:hypothetical protein
MLTLGDEQILNLAVGCRRLDFLAGLDPRMLLADWPVSSARGEHDEEDAWVAPGHRLRRLAGMIRALPAELAITPLGCEYRSASCPFTNERSRRVG